MWFTNAAEPNYVRSRVINVDGAFHDVVSTQYSDGLGRSIQSKQRLSETQARVVSTFYDEAGRPYLSTKPFIDKAANSVDLFTPGDFNEIKSTINASAYYYAFTSGGTIDAFAYSESEYYDDPLGRVKRAGAPGWDYRLESDHFTSSWTFGIVKNLASPIHLTVEGVDIYIKTTDGFVDAFSNYAATISVPLTSKILDQLYDELLNNPIANADYFLSVSRDSDGKISQELKDLFGNTLYTRSDNVAEKIIAEYQYDILGNLLFEKAPVATNPIADTRYTYNTLGQLIKKITPDGGTFGYAYTPTGQLASDTSYGSFIYRIRRYQYDDLDRLKSTELKDNNDPDDDDWSIVVSNYYDNFDDLENDIPSYVIPRWLLSFLTNLHGRLVASVAVNRINGLDYYVCDLYSYNDEGRINGKHKIVPGMQLQEIYYTYDNHGKILKDSTVCGAQTIAKEYKYDQDGRLIQAVHTNDGTTTGKPIASYNYDDLGHTKNKILGISSGHQIDYGYNIRDWVTSIAPMAGNHYLNKFTEIIGQYQANGNILKALYTYEGNSPPAQNFDLTYSYDDVNRLTAVVQTDGAGFNAHYSYDEAGRLGSKEEGSVNRPKYEYYAQNSRLKNTSGSDSHHYLYDKNGNLVVDKNKKMVIEYDWRDMPIAFRFYSSLPAGIQAHPSGSGEYVITAPFESEHDLYNYMARQASSPTSGVTLLSQVVMCYDASGNRVLKMESK
jgi:YD repeat-containing protein